MTDHCASVTDLYLLIIYVLYLLIIYVLYLLIIYVLYLHTKLHINQKNFFGRMEILSLADTNW